MEKLTRNQLFTLVWTEPLTTLAKRFGLTDATLRKICKDHNIPTPRMGYWMKIKHGKEVSKPDLPVGDEKDGALIDFKEESGTSGLMSINVREKILIEDSGLDFRVPLRLVNPDKLIVAARTSLESGNHKSYRSGLLSCNRRELDIQVTAANIGRAVRFMDVLIKVLRQRGHDLVTQYDRTRAIIDGEEFDLKLREKTKREIIVEKNGWNSSVYHPTGLLYISVGHYYPDYTWIDGKSKIEDQLPRILARMEYDAEKRKEEKIRYRKEEEIRLEKERILKEAERLKEKEREDFKNLLNDATKWQQAALLREYLASVEKEAMAAGGLTPEMENWLNWARRKVEEYDPLKRNNRPFSVAPANG